MFIVNLNLKSSQFLIVLMVFFSPVLNGQDDLDALLGDGGEAVSETVSATFKTTNGDYSDLESILPEDSLIISTFEVAQVFYLLQKQQILL